MKEDMTQDYLKHRVIYYPETGRMYWRSHPQTNLVGEEVGGTDKNGYRVCRLDSKAYRVHRLVFLYMINLLPSEDLLTDHINGDRLDNRWVNLRLCTQTQNLQNAKIRKDNPTGIKGLMREKGVGKRNPSYSAIVRANGVITRKRLSFTSETEAAVKQELIDWLISQRNKLHKEFANHG